MAWIFIPAYYFARSRQDGKYRQKRRRREAAAAKAAAEAGDKDDRRAFAAAAALRAAEDALPPPTEYGPREALAYAAFRAVPAYGVVRRVLRDTATRLGNVRVGGGCGGGGGGGGDSSSYDALNDPDDEEEGEGAFQPRSMLDFGAGPGTGAWAALETFGGSLRHVRCVDPSRAMRGAARRLLGAEGAPKCNVSFATSLLDLESAAGDDGASGDGTHDLVLASSALSELPSARARAAAAALLWRHTAPGGVLVVAEPGTRQGFHVVREARRAVLSAANGDRGAPAAAAGADGLAGEGARVVAPCPHGRLRCPATAAGMHCHFPQSTSRLVRDGADDGGRRRRRRSGDATTGLEYFSYVAIQKLPLPDAAVARERAHRDAEASWKSFALGDDDGWARCVRAPLKRGGHVTADLCTAKGGIARYVFTRGHHGSGSDASAALPPPEDAGWYDDGEDDEYWSVVGGDARRALFPHAYAAARGGLSWGGVWPLYMLPGKVQKPVGHGTAPADPGEDVAARAAAARADPEGVREEVADDDLFALLDHTSPALERNAPKRR